MAAFAMNTGAGPRKTSTPEGTTSDNASDGKWHPSFCSASADIILCSNDNTLFRVHSHMLQIASGWFRGMLALPQPQSCSPALDQITLGEDGDVLSGLLTMISGMELPTIDSAERLEAMLLAAEKYDMPGPVSIIRIALFNPFLQASPVRLYGIAFRRGWIREAELASSRTLTLDLCAPEVFAELSALDNSAMTKLVLLHRRRRDGLRTRLDDAATFTANVTTTCKGCKAHTGNEQWHRLKYNWLSSMERQPFGAVLEAIDLEREEVRVVLEAKCEGCQRFFYGRTETCANLRKAIASLPTTVEFSDSVV